METSQFVRGVVYEDLEYPLRDLINNLIDAVETEVLKSAEPIMYLRSFTWVFRGKR